ncbi:MAG: leucyl aminopeptidase, partial [Haemophilus parainfluenzae]|nr:leucyl aminopeptidase [Haemophilus parainfluenzae]
MKYQANSTAFSQSTDCLIIGIYENNELTKSFNEIDQITQGYLSQLAQSQDLSGKIGQTTLLHSLPNLATKRVLVAGCGKKGEMTERQFKQIIQRVTQTLKELKIQQAVNNLTDVE